MLECKGNRLIFTFPEVHADARVEIEFERTLRIPDDGNNYGLPPGLGAFPLRNVDDHRATLSADTLERGGVMLPMYQSEALWISFQGHHNYASNRGHAYPFALKIGAGKRSAVTGRAWDSGLTEKDYVVIPVQPWLDGFMLDAGTIRQFIAAPLGGGYTVEEQLTGKAEFGGIQIEAIPMKAEEFEKRFPVRPDHRLVRRSRLISKDAPKGGGSFGDDDLEICSFNAAPTAARGPMRSATAVKAKSMGMAAGGRMKQDIIPDPYGLGVWDTAHTSRTFVHLFNSMLWQQITDSAPPGAPRTAADYSRAGLPWYDYYQDGGSLGSTEQTVKIKSAAQLDAEKGGLPLLPENESVATPKIVTIKAPPSPHEVKNGNW